MGHDPSRTTYYVTTLILKLQSEVEAAEGVVLWHAPLQRDAPLRLVHGFEVLCIRKS